jgi:hypothetical protein
MTDIVLNLRRFSGAYSLAFGEDGQQWRMSVPRGTKALPDRAAITPW